VKNPDNPSRCLSYLEMALTNYPWPQNATSKHDNHWEWTIKAVLDLHNINPSDKNHYAFVHSMGTQSDTLGDMYTAMNLVSDYVKYDIDYPGSRDGGFFTKATFKNGNRADVTLDLPQNVKTRPQQMFNGEIPENANGFLRSDYETPLLLLQNGKIIGIKTYPGPTQTVQKCVQPGDCKVTTGTGPLSDFIRTTDFQLLHVDSYNTIQKYPAYFGRTVSY